MVGATVAVWIASLREGGERTNDHLLAQNALAVTLVESRSLADGTPKALEAIGRTLGWQLGALWAVDEADEVLCASWTCGRSPASRPQASSG